VNTDPTLTQHPEIYRVINFEAVGQHRRPDLHVELDTEDDYAMISTICEELKGVPNFGLDHILDLLQQYRKLAEKNGHVVRRWVDRFSPDLDPNVKSYPVDELLSSLSVD
jgi:spore coat polysaccharide biosynthesis protein SpsF (cytidylyltransferase family)